MKYEKPQLIDISKLDVVQGACVPGDSNIQQCGPGGNVIPGCMPGGRPTVVCEVGSNFTAFGV